METRPDNLSIIRYFSREKSGHCGYCKGEVGYERYGLWAHELNVADYQDLIDRGWRRCGRYCYKPIMDETCCPLYTIRASANDFYLSKSQKKILKRVNHFLKTGDKGSAKAQSNVFPMTSQLDMESAIQAEKKIKRIIPNFSSSNIVSSSSDDQEADKGFSNNKDFTSHSVINEVTLKEKLSQNSAKKKHLRMLRKYNKLKAKGLSEEDVLKKMVAKKRYNRKKTLEDFIDVEEPVKGVHHLEVRLVRSSPKSDDFKASFSEGFLLYKKYQINIHKDSPSKIDEQSYRRFLVTSPLETKLLGKETYSSEACFSLHASLFEKYQKAIHHESDDECDSEIFRDFLVVSPLQVEGPYGSFHQQYWLDDKLIAVGVIDLLPHCLSSVYFFYDPDYSFLSLGTYGALRELYMVRELSKSYPNLQFTYMGFFIENCPKMRYKAAFKPSFLLCPEVYTWHPIENAVEKIKKSKYSRLNEDKSSGDSGCNFNPSKVKILHRNWIYEARKLPDIWTSNKSLLEEYCAIVGANCAQRMILERDDWD